MSISTARLTLAARRSAGDRVIDALLPLEQGAHETAIHAARCQAALLEAHTHARLAPGVGMAALELVAQASLLAAQSRAKVGELRDMLRTLSETHRVTYAAPAECPPNTMTSDA